MNICNDIVSNNIKKYRKQRCMTQKELAEKLNKSEITIRKYESGDISLSIDILNQISKILDIHPLDLLYNSEQLNKEVDMIEAFDVLLSSLNYKIKDLNEYEYEDFEKSVLEFIEFKFNKLKNHR